MAPCMDGVGFGLRLCLDYLDSTARDWVGRLSGWTLGVNCCITTLRPKKAQGPITCLLQGSLVEWVYPASLPWIRPTRSGIGLLHLSISTPVLVPISYTHPAIPIITA